ncbi:MAG: glycosyltransferase family 2 protein [Bacteroidaceae bacterium]|nr:glycosyltransferase family 2 protein [Bacteroidaceae bacterium]
MIRFSVVIPLYNKRNNIASTLESVLNQTCMPEEIIVVDDGSTDGGSDVVSGFQKRFPFVKLIKKKNGGVCSARNEGVRCAACEYVALLDADDIWDKEYLAEQKRLVEDFPEAKLWGINYAEMEKGQLARFLPTGLPERYRGYVDNYFSIPGRVSDLFCSSSVVIERSVFDDVGYFDERIKYAEDNDMWWRIIASYKVVFYDKYMAFYQFDGENRALMREKKLKDFLPYYVDKYESYKLKNWTFYQWVNRWCAVHIRNYYFNQKMQRCDAKVAAAKLDFSVIPFKYRLLFKTPFFVGYLVYTINNIKNKMSK